METTKKRKRDVDLPRIVYDATTRVFDRLFKEDSLEGMKDVVRKKLGIPASAPVQLAQLRDGQTVDLEDDDDFEAFLSSTYKSSTAKVKIIVGSGVTVQPNGIHLVSSQTPEPSEKKKKKKEKKSREVSVPAQDQPETVTPPTTPSESQPPPKKRRVSFVDHSRIQPKEHVKVTAEDDQSSSPNDSERESTEPKEIGGRDTAKDRNARRKDKKIGKHLQKLKDAEAESSKEASPVVEEDSASKDGKKKKKRKKKKAADLSKEDDATATPEPQPVNTADKPAKKKPQKTLGGDDTAADEVAKSKKSNKRPRAAEDDSAAMPEPEKATSTEAPAVAGETERLAKKRKQSHKESANAESGNMQEATNVTHDTSANTAVPKNPKKSKVKSPAVVPEDPEPEVDVPAEENITAKTPKKYRRKSDAQPPVSPTPATKQPAEKSKDSTSQPKDTPPVVLEAVEKAAKSKPRKSVDAVPTQTEAKTPKSSAKKTGTAEPSEDMQEATRAAIQAILRRRGISVEPNLAPTTPAKTAGASTSKSADTTPADDATPSAASTKKTSAPKPSAAKAPASLEIADPTLLQMTSSDESSALTSAKTPAARVIVPSPASQAAGMKAPLTSAQILEQAKKAAAANGSNGTSTSTTIEKVSTSAKKKAPLPAKCGVCDQSWHIRSKCPIIKSGIRAMRKRITELEAKLEEESEDEDEDEDEDSNKELIPAIIEELHQLIEKKTKKPRASDAKQQAAAAAATTAEERAPATAPAVKSVRIDASHKSSEVNVVPSSAAQQPLHLDIEPFASPPPPTQPVFLTQPKTSANHVPPSSKSLLTIQPLSAAVPAAAAATTHHPRLSQLPPLPTTQPPPKKSRQSMPAATSTSAFALPTLPSFTDLTQIPAGLLGFAGNISSISDHDLEELMRGPKLTSQDVPSEDEQSLASDEEDQREPGVVLEEDVVDEPSQKTKKNAGKVEYPSSSDEGDEDEDESAEGGSAAAPSPEAVDNDSEDAVQVQKMTVGSAVVSLRDEEEREGEDENEEEREQEKGDEEDEEEEEEEKKGEKEGFEEDDEDDAPLSAMLKLTEGQADEPVDEDEEEQLGAGHKSFQEMNISDSSRSSTQAGNAAVNEAVSADLELPTSTPAAVLKTTITTTNGTSQDSATQETVIDTVAASAAAPEVTSQTPANADIHAPDPIEDEPEPHASQPDTILSADDAEPTVPKESTPKEKIALRKSQRNASVQLSVSQPPPTTQSRATRSKNTAAAAAAETSSSQPEPITPAATTAKGRKATEGKKLTRISELPVPVPPAANVNGRVTRGTQSHAQALAAAATPVPATPRPTRSTRAAAAAMATPAAASKAAAKAPATPAGGRVVQVLAAVAAAADAGKAASKAKPSAVGKPSSKAATAAASKVRTRASRLTADLESDGEKREEQEKPKGKAKAKRKPKETPAEPEPEVSLASWVVLPESQSGPSLNESELQPASADVDELMSSPSANITGGKRKAASHKSTPTPEPEPLFIEAESQQSFPYSQFPLTQTQAPGRSRSASPNDSEDNDDTKAVAEVVRGRPSMGSQYRSLTEIASQGGRMFAPRYSSQLAVSSQKEPDDLFGLGQQEDDDESEESDTESEDEGQDADRKKGSAHIPSTRLAGAAIPPRR